VALAFHDSGQGPALLFLHAFPLDASQWDHQVAALSGHRCIRVDMWGCGESPPPQGDGSLDEVAASVIAGLDERGVDTFATVGLSMGGYMAFALWRAAASRVTAMALCNTRATADSDTSRADRLAMADRIVAEDSVESLVEPMVERLLGPRARAEVHVTDPLRGRVRRCTPAGIAFAQRAMAARPDSTPQLATLTMPVLVIGGRDDAMIPLAETQAMAAAIPAARFVAMSCGHLSNLEDPREFNGILDEFLSAGHA
jgi:pimeloyl-ACP methyl ester carboxylesterase